jgi:ankyrin repeat protein
VALATWSVLPLPAAAGGGGEAEGSETLDAMVVVVDELRVSPSPEESGQSDHRRWVAGDTILLTPRWRAGSDGRRWFFIDRAQQCGWVAEISAAGVQQLSTVDAALSRRATMLQPPVVGDSCPLFTAVARGEFSVAMVRLAECSGALASVVTRRPADGKRPLTVAAQLNHAQLVRLLLAAERRRATALTRIQVLAAIHGTCQKLPVVSADVFCAAVRKVVSAGMERTEVDPDQHPLLVSAVLWCKEQQAAATKASAEAAGITAGDETPTRVRAVSEIADRSPVPWRSWLGTALRKSIPAAMQFGDPMAVAAAAAKRQKEPELEPELEPEPAPEPEPEVEPAPKKSKDEWLTFWRDSLRTALSSHTLSIMEQRIGELDGELATAGEASLAVTLPLLAGPFADLQRAKIECLASAALFVAVDHGSVEAAAQLLRDGAVVNTRRRWGQARAHCTPLFIAAATGNASLVRLLLLANVDASVAGRTEDGATAMHAAVRNGELEVVSQLLRFGSTTDDILSACPKGGTAHSCERATTLVWRAAADALTLEQLVQQSHHALRGYATTVGLAQTSELIDDWHAIHAASAGTDGAVAAKEAAAQWLDRLEVHQASLEHCCPLLLAVELGYTGVVRALLVAGADVDVVRPLDGLGVLHIAAVRNHAPTLRALLEGGANPQWRRASRTKDGPMPIHLAASLGHGAVVAELLREGGTGMVTSTTRGGLTPLLLAADGGHNSVVALLQRWLSHQRHRTHRNRLPTEAWSRRIGPRGPEVPTVRTVASMWWPAHEDMSRARAEQASEEY